MPLDEDKIAELQARLAIYRRNLGHVLRQAAMYGGEDAASPWIMHEIAAARAEIRRLKEALRAAGVAVEDHPDDRDPASPGYMRAALHQLRAPAGDFVGRAREIDQLVHALSTAGETASAIGGVCGMGGIGKTELAHVVAHRLMEHFPDARLLVTLGGSQDTPLSAVQALQTVIRAFDRAAKLPNDLKQLTARYISTLAGKRVLILLDDAKDQAQVYPLLPPPGCALLITSRGRFTLPGMRMVNLRTLTAGEAKQLLLTICPRIGGAAPALARLCGYLPLALRVSASILENRPARRVDAYVQQLGDERTRLEYLREPYDPELDVAASLRLSYSALEPAAQSVFCQLGVFVTSFDLEAARKVVVAHGNGMVDAILEALVRLSLLEWNEHTMRYSLHELVRVFAYQHLAAVAAVSQRYANHYLALAEMAEPELRNGQQPQQLRALDREYAHLCAGLSWAIEQREITIALSFTRALGPYWALRGYVGQGLAWLDAVLDLSSAIPITSTALSTARAYTLDAAGALALEQADYGKAERMFATSQALWRTLNTTCRVAAALNNLAQVAGYQGDTSRAEQFYTESLTLYRLSPDRRGEAAVLCNLGVLAINQGSYTAAATHLEKGLAILKQLNDQRNSAMHTTNLGDAYRHQGNIAAAIVTHQASLQLCRALKDPWLTAAALESLGADMLRYDNPEQAVPCLTESLRLFQQIGDGDGIICAVEGFAVVAWMWGQLERAARLLIAAQNERARIGAPLAKPEQRYFRDIKRSITSRLGKSLFGKKAADRAAFTITIDQAVAEIQKHLA